MSMTAPSRAFEDRHILAVALRLPSFEEALSRLLYVVEQRRPCGLVLGLAGTGKTVLLEALFRELSGSASSETWCRPLRVDLSTAGGSGLAWAVASEIGLAPRSNAHHETLWRSIEDRFQGASMSGQSIVPIIDHLEQADKGAVASLGRCCHLAARFGSTVVVSARPPLGPALTSVAGPLCDLRIELPAWTPSETATFVSQVLEGERPPRMDEDAVAAIHACSGGRMRDTVHVLRLTVFAARAQGLDVVDADFVQTVAGEIWQPSTRLPANLSRLPAAVGS